MPAGLFDAENWDFGDAVEVCTTAIGRTAWRPAMVVRAADPGDTRVMVRYPDGKVSTVYRSRLRVDRNYVPEAQG